MILKGLSNKDSVTKISIVLGPHEPPEDILGGSQTPPLDIPILGEPLTFVIQDQKITSVQPFKGLGANWLSNPSGVTTGLKSLEELLAIIFELETPPNDNKYFHIHMGTIHSIGLVQFNTSEGMRYLVFHTKNPTQIMLLHHLSDVSENIHLHTADLRAISTILSNTRKSISDARQEIIANDVRNTETATINGLASKVPKIPKMSDSFANILIRLAPPELIGDKSLITKVCKPKTIDYPKPQPAEGSIEFFRTRFAKPSVNTDQSNHKEPVQPLAEGFDMISAPLCK